MSIKFKQIINQVRFITSGVPGSTGLPGSNDWNDITNKPTIPDEQVNSDWSSTSGKSEILNKPNLNNFLEVTDVQAGTNITLAVVGKTVTISSSGGGSGGASSFNVDSNFNIVGGINYSVSGYANTLLTTDNNTGNNINGQDNILIGYKIGQALFANNQSNILIGNYSGKWNQLNYCIGLGHYSLHRGADHNIAIGYYALNNVTTQNNIAIGEYSLSYHRYTNCIAIGNYLSTSGNNEIQIGDATQTVYTFSPVQTRSDERDKIDARDCSLSKDFLLSIKPREYRYNYRELYKEKIKNEDGSITIKELINDGSKAGKRFHQGYFAGDFLNTGFGGVQDHLVNNGEDVKTLDYTQMIPIIHKAFIDTQIEDIQPIKKQLEEQKELINNLINEINLLKNIINKV